MVIESGSLAVRAALNVVSNWRKVAFSNGRLSGVLLVFEGSLENGPGLSVPGGHQRLGFAVEP